MAPIALTGHAGTRIDIDVCHGCHAFWFDARESLQLSPASTLRLFTLIGETSGSRTTLAPVLRCPRCQSRLLSTNDFQRNTSFRYWRCDRGDGNSHGRFITFFDFLREKNFVRPMTGQQIDDLRKNIQFVNCSNCGGPVDLTKGSACGHCGTPLSMLDSKQAEATVEQLKRAAEPRPVDPTLPLQMERARREVEATFAAAERGHDWWSNAASSGLVEASFSALMTLLKSKNS